MALLTVIRNFGNTGCVEVVYRAKDGLPHTHEIGLCRGEEIGLCQGDAIIWNGRVYIFLNFSPDVSPMFYVEISSQRLFSTSLKVVERLYGYCCWNNVLSKEWRQEGYLRIHRVA